MKLKRIVNIEIDRVKITTTACAENILRCELCGAETEFLSRAQASELAKIMRAQGLKINQATLHFYERGDEEILICLDSIVAGGNNTVIHKLIS